jgi:hypothetical protein
VQVEERRTGGESESEIGRVRNWLKGIRVFRRHFWFPAISVSFEPSSILLLS